MTAVCMCQNEVGVYREGSFRTPEPACVGYAIIAMLPCESGEQVLVDAAMPHGCRA
jgi:hypothetical protein